MNTAIVGIGKWGKNVARELAQTSNLVAYVHQGNSDDDLWATKHIPSAQKMNLRELCSDQSITVVSVAVPIENLEEVTEKLLQSKKHVLVEKPVATTSSGARKLTTLALKKDLVLNAGYIFVHSDQYKQLKKKMSEDTIHTIECVWEKYGTFNQSISLNLFIHHLSIAIDFWGQPTSLRRITEARENEEYIEVFLKNKKMTSFINRESKKLEHTIKFIGEESYIWDANAQQKTKQPLQCEIESFLSEVNGKERSATGGDFAVRVLEAFELLKPTL